VAEISPDEVHLSTPFRVPAEDWVREPSCERVAFARRMLGEKTRVLMPTAADASLGDADPVEAIVDVILRHPMSDQELRAALARSMQEPDLGLRRLIEDGRVQQVCRDGGLFWCPAHSDYRPSNSGVTRTRMQYKA